MMRHVMLVMLLFITSVLRAEVYYFSSDTITAPKGEITAIEVRAANSLARVGEAKLAGWFVAWDSVKVELIFDFRNYIDGISSAFATIECNGFKSVIKKNLNVSGGFNSLAIEWHYGGQVKILCGERKMQELIQLDNLLKPSDTIVVGKIGDGDIIIQDFIVETNSNSFKRLKSVYSSAELAQAKHWEYLDRINDPNIAIVGGSYVLAQIGNELIYLSGAKTNASSWSSGMLKGELLPTGFEGYYKLTWYDATGRKMPGENFAELDSDLGVLKLTFPELSASIRLKLTDE